MDRKNLSLHYIEQKLKELADLYNKFEVFMHTMTGVKGAGEMVRHSENISSLLYGQHKIYSQVNGAAAEGAFELARAVVDRIIQARQEVVEAMLPKIKNIACRFLKKYFSHLSEQDKEDVLTELVTEGCSGVLKKIGQIRIGEEYNIYESFNYLCRAAMMGMKKYVETELRYGRIHVQPTVLVTSKKQNGSTEGSEEEIDIFDRIKDDAEMNQERCVLQMDKLQKFMEGLSDVERYVFLRELEGYTDAEVSELLGISINQARRTKAAIHARVLSI